MSTADDIATLQAALAKGVRRVKFHDREVEYATLREIGEAIERLQAQLAAASGAAGFRLTPLAHGDGK